MATKFVYSDTEITEITAKYLAGDSLELLAETYAKSVPSIRMKLVKLGVYQKQAKTATTKTSSEAKKPASTTKSAILADFKRAYDLVGDAPF